MDDKTLPPKRNRMTASLPKRRKKSSEPITPRIRQAFGREENIANNDEERKKAIAQTLANAEAERLVREEEERRKAILAEEERRKAIAAKNGNHSSHAKNIIYYEDTVPLRTLFGPRNSFTAPQDRFDYKKHGYTGEVLQKKEEELLALGGEFTRETLLLYYCLNLLGLVRNPKTISMNSTHIFPHESFGNPTKNWPSKQYHRKIRKKEAKDRGHYVSNPYVPPFLENPPDFNKDLSKVHNMHAYFLDTDGFGFDEIITPETPFEFRKISSTVTQLTDFFLSAETWLEGTEKFLGLVHPNAEKIKLIGFNEEASEATKSVHTKFSALGHGYYLPQAYRRDYCEIGTVDRHFPHQIFSQMFEQEIHSRLQNSINSNCDDLMENYNGPSYFQKASYCESQLIAAYISKASQQNPQHQNNPNWRKLEDICTKLKPNMIKDVFTKTNFVTLYRVKKIDSTHVTIEKETFDEPAKKSLEKKLDEMLSRLEEE